jgi:protein-S-isoprenylcysteine O-methyltransferase Ste14
MEFGLFNEGQWLLFGFSALALAIFSRRSLANPRCHGFYRFFAFLAIAALLILNAPYWHVDLFAPHQLLSWLMLACSGLFVVWGFYLLLVKGGRRDSSINAENFEFENTAELITCGIFRYIRHPMYSSLLLLSWGAMFKYLSVASVLLTALATVFLMLAARFEERENLAFFGEIYQEYMGRSKKFLPRVF